MNKKNIILVIVMLLIGLNSVVLCSEQIENTLVYSDYKLPSYWASDFNIGLKLKANESINSKLVKSYRNKNNGSTITVFRKELRSFYSVDYFLGKDSNNSFISYYDLKKPNIASGPTKLKTGVMIAKTDIKNIIDKNPLFKRGIWLYYPVSLSHKKRMYYSNYLFMVIFRNNSLSNKSQAYIDFNNWYRGLKLNYLEVEVVTSALVKEMRKVLKKDKLNQKPLIKKSDIEVLESSKKINKRVINNMSLTTEIKNVKANELDKLMAKWTAPNNIFKVRSVDGKKTDGNLNYDFNTNSLILNSSGKLITIKWDDIKDYAIYYKEPWLKSGRFHLKISFRDVKKGKLDIAFSNLNKYYGKIVINDFIDKIRKINELYY